MIMPSAEHNTQLQSMEIFFFFCHFSATKTQTQGDCGGKIIGFWSKPIKAAPNFTAIYLQVVLKFLSGD